MSAAIFLRGLDFAFAGKPPLFKNFSLTLGSNSPAVILGPSGCGKTTLLRLIAGLLKPQAGEIIIENAPDEISFVFQEPRLLPWKTVIENVSLPLLKTFGKKESMERARHFLALVSLEDKMYSLPKELSGGQQQRVNLARAFAFPAPILLMDEPFQSLDIPLRLNLMDTTTMLLEETPRLAIAVSHDPREAAYFGKRVIVLGEKAQGLVHEELLNFNEEERRFGSAAQGALEQKLLAFFESSS